MKNETNVSGHTNAAERQAFAIRLRRALEAGGIRASPTVVANEFNLRYWGQSITSHTARSWLLGISIPMQDKLKVLAEWLQVSTEELRFGEKSEGSMWQEQVMGMQDKEMLRRYLALPQEDKMTARDVVKALWLADRTKQR